jgi:hypothetical protein
VKGQPVETCVVCGETVDETNSAVCQGCNRRYHLVLRQGAQGKDCGDVWINEAFMSLQFACFSCLRGARADSAPAAAGMPAASEPASAQQPRWGDRPDEQAPPSRARHSRSQRRYRKR